MASLTFTLEGQTTTTVVKTISDQDAARLITAFATIFEPQIGSTPTVQQIVEAWVDSVVIGAVRQTKEVEAAAISDITVT